ncbi:MAG: glycosyltransferase [Deltaproteobacteria bacterium]|nr:glycosyltransferase [Deltaproteobacteria bacterium]
MESQFILPVIAIVWFLLVAHFLTAIGRIFFQREMLETTTGFSEESWPFVSIIIPARNEEKNITRCLEGLLNQSYPKDRYRIIVVDDDSSDRTAARVMSLQELHPNLCLVSADGLPEGWTGKNHACALGAKHATGVFLCFIDADLFAGPHLLSSAISYAVDHRVALLSLSPFQELVSLAERILLPGIFICIASTMNFKNINKSSKPDAVANGQFLLFKRESYDAVSGHEGIRGEIMDDLALARKIKASGLRLAFLFGDALARTRMYDRWTAIWEGFSKNLSEIVRTERISRVIGKGIQFLMLAWMPLALPLLTCSALAQSSNLLSCLSFYLAMAGAAGLLIAMIATIKTLGLPAGYALFFPVSLTMFVIILINSFMGKRMGRRAWKGRVYQSDDS